MEQDRKESPAQTKKDVEKLKREIHAQNRKLLLACLIVLILGVGLFFGAKAIVNHAQPGPWTYENALQEVYDGKENDNQYTYNGIVFARQSDQALWTFRGVVHNQTYDITSYYSPREIADLQVSGNVQAQVLPKHGIIITLNPDLDYTQGGAANAAIAAIEIGKIVGTKNDILNKPTATTVTHNTNTTNVTMTASCENASISVGIIQLELANQTQVVAANNCILIHGATPDDLIRAADAVMYRLLGIIKPDNTTA